MKLKVLGHQPPPIREEYSLEEIRGGKFKVYGQSGDYVLFAYDSQTPSPHYRAPLTLYIHNTSNGRVHELDLTRQGMHFNGNYRGANGRVYAAKECLPHRDGTFTVVSVAGIVSRWASATLQLQNYTLIPEANTYQRRVLQVAEVVGNVYVTTLKDSKIELFCYDGHEVVPIDPGVLFTRIASAGDKLELSTKKSGVVATI